MSSQRGFRRQLADRVQYAALWSLREGLRRLPLARALGVGAAMGRSYAKLGGPRTDVARINLELAFPHWSPAARERVLVGCFENLGRGVAEVAQLAGPGRRELIERVRVEGHEHYEAARGCTDSGGLLVLSAHFGSWELLGASMVHHGYPVCTVHHALENPHLDRMVAEWRKQGGLATLELGRAGLSILHALGRGQAVGLLLDQNAGREEAVFAPFFSHAASTRSAPARLAMARGIPVLPVFFFREKDGSGHVTKIYPALELEEEGEDSEAALRRNVTRMNRAIELAIEESPEQWMWVHKRWKTRPEEDPEPIYPRRRRGRRARAGRPELAEGAR